MFNLTRPERAPTGVRSDPTQRLLRRSRTTPARGIGLLRLSLRGLWAHKVRFLLTGLAVVLGVAFMAGTMILTDTMGKTFDGLFATSNESIDVVVHRSTGVDGKGVDVQE